MPNSATALRMRVLFVQSPADLYGASRALLRLCRDMRRSQWEVAVILPEEGALSNRLAEEGVEIFFAPSIAKVERKNFTTAVGVLRFLRDVFSDISAQRRIFAQWRPDIIHTNTSLIPSAAVTAILTGRPHLWHLRESFTEFPRLWAIYKHIMGALSTRIVCCSKVAADQFAGTWVAPRTRIVYEGLSSSEFLTFSATEVARWRRQFSPEGGPVVGVVGRIRMVRKGQEVFVAAAEQLAGAFPTARFVCIGDAYPGNESHVDELRHRIERAGIGSRFEITGDIEDVAAATAALDIAVMPSVVPEPFGNVVMEAMCLGKPVVASANGGGREQIEDGVTGFLVPPGDADALARALATLLADPDRAHAMGEAGRRRFEALFTSEDGHAAVRRLYAELGFRGAPEYSRAFMSKPPIKPPNFTHKRILVTGGSGFIGTNLLLRLESEPADVLNLDIKAPNVAALRASWRSCDITDAAATHKAIVDFAPHYVIHLAGRTDMLGKSVSEYDANPVGSRNVIHGCLAAGSVERFIHTSSQFVCGPGPLPENDVDFRPHTLYGESKAMAERELRALDPSFIWSIIRPTNVWGAFHPRYPQEFWRVLRRGLYLHPGGRQVIRSYAYVGNVVEQALALLGAIPDSVHRHVFYVGDPPKELLEWVDGFAVALTGRHVRKVPVAILHSIALLGDIVESILGRAPLTRSRLRSMTQDYVTPMEPTYALLGPPRFSFDEGVAATTAWLRTLPEFSEVPQSR
jgi:GlcNAc-P-P-Und epimerase